MKTDDYAALYRLNRQFDSLAQCINKLQAAGLLPPESAEARKAALEYVRARLNSGIARALETREAEDLCRYEDLRIAAIRKEAAAEQTNEKIR